MKTIITYLLLVALSLCSCGSVQPDESAMYTNAERRVQEYLYVMITTCNCRIQVVHDSEGWEEDDNRLVYWLQCHSPKKILNVTYTFYKNTKTYEMKVVRVGTNMVFN